MKKSQRNSGGAPISDSLTAPRMEEDLLDNQETFRIVAQHSNRILYEYDLASRTTRPWSATDKEKDILAHLYTGVYSDDALEKNKAVLSESVENTKKFFADIHSGVPDGELNIHICMEDGTARWYQFKYSNIFEQDKPVNALISVEDITESYERDHRQELDRAGLLQVAMMSFPEILSVNLTKGTYRMIQYYGATTLGTPAEGPLDQMLLPRLENVAPEDKELFKKHFFVEGLRKAFEEGKQQVQLTYRRRGADGVWHWVETIAMGQENPYDDDLLAFAVSRNVDEEKAKENRLQDQLRQQTEELRITMSRMGNHISYYDINTGTLTTIPQTAKMFGVPVVLENYPESFIATAPEGYPQETAEKLRAFVAAMRRGDPTGSCDYPTVTVDGEKVWLRREFATIFDENDRPVRAVISSEDVTAQYVQNQQNEVSRDGLIKVAQLMFPEILSCNLSRGTCDVIRSTIGTPEGLPLDKFLLSRLEDIAPEDREAFKRQFFRENQLAAMAEGRERFQLTYRRRGADGQWHWIETIALQHKNPYNDEVLAFAVSRNVDQQKAQEELLRQALADSTEKLEGWFYYTGLSNQIFPGLIYLEYEDGRPSPYTVGQLARKLDCPARELALGTCFRIPREDRDALPRAYQQAKEAGESSYQAEYRIEQDRGPTAWVFNHAIQFEDKDGAAGYIHFLRETTNEHVLMEQLRASMEEKAKEDQKIFQTVAQHSNRTLYAYDLATGTTRPWDTESGSKDVLAHLYTGSYSDEALEGNQAILPDSISNVKKFFADIHSGVPSGDLNIHVKLVDGEARWYHFQYTSFFEAGRPTTALISVEDVTERHAHEVAYRRYVQSVEHDAEGHTMYIESDLTDDRIEKLSGKMFNNEERNIQCSHSDFGSLLLDQKFRYEEQEEAVRYFSCENLLDHYDRRERQLKSVWKVYFNDDSSGWMDTETVLMEDPYNGHIKAFFRMMDITEEYEKQQSALQRADYEGMTGLLRKDTGEERIKQYMKETDGKGGILILLDLDDLKGINDTLGHKAGDAAIMGIANTIKSHFRKTDVLVRAGGDEFIVFLPGAGQSVSSVELSMASLLRKLSGISIGDNNERTIHCSAGCAVELPKTDTFESLYQRADIALYHVKRNGKNSFAFFEEGMLHEDFDFKTKQAVPAVTDDLADNEMRHLMEIIGKHYPGIIQFNLSKNYFRAVAVGKSMEALPASGTIDVFLHGWSSNIHPEDKPGILAVLSREGLLDQYAQGQKRMQCYCRYLEETETVKVEVSVNFYTTDTGDICSFIFLRREILSGKERELLRLKKILELSSSEFEYICLIDVRDNTYSTFSRESDNSHEIPEIADFDLVTKYIRDSQIPAEEREAYYESAALSNVVRRMSEAMNYSYRYTMTDGTTREVVFHWYEDSHSELLMTVRKIV